MARRFCVQSCPFIVPEIIWNLKSIIIEYLCNLNLVRRRKMGGKRTPLYGIYQKYQGKVIDYSGWELPVQFTGITSEHLAVRQAAGLFDVSHMGEITVSGNDAEGFLQYILTNDVTAMNDNDVIYSFMCYENGGVVDDLLAYKYDKTAFLLVVNASNTVKDYDWLVKHASGYDVEISDISHQTAELALQGPKAEEILQKLTDQDLNSVGFFQFRDNVDVQGIACLISRTGYTGEDGFEIYTDNELAIKLWELLMDAGQDLGLKAAGLGSRDTLRFEAALPLYGQELTEQITPLEAGLGYFVKLDKDFIGKNALVQQKKAGLKRKLVGFELLEKGIARHEYQVVNQENEDIGWVTTGYKAPSVGKSIGLALVNIDYSKRGTIVFIRVRKKLVKAKVISKKFYSKNYKKI